MSANLITIPASVTYRFNDKGIENKSINSHSQFQAISTPTKQATNKVSILNSKYQNVPELSTDKKPHVSRRPEINSLTPKKSQIDQQRQIEKIKNFYEEAMSTLKKEHLKALTEVSDLRRVEQKEKQFWKEKTLLLINGSDPKNNNFQTLVPSFRPQIYSPSQEAQKMRQLQEEVERLRNKNSELTQELKKSYNNVKRLLDDNRVKDDNLKMNVKTNVDLQSSFCGKQYSKSRHEPKHHHSHHHKPKTEVVQPLLPSKELEKANKMNQTLIKTVQQTNEQLMKEKMKLMNLKYSKNF